MEKIYKRELYLRKIRGFYDDTMIKVITGIRRCGKSYLLKTIINELKEKGVSDNDIIYIELDKKEFKDIDTPKKLEKVIDGFVNDKAFKYLFIDEVQNVKNFAMLYILGAVIVISIYFIKVNIAIIIKNITILDWSV